MTKKYTEQEVLSALNSLTSKPEVLDRRGNQSAEEIIRSLVEFIYSSLNSDIDSVYSLIMLLVRRQAKSCTELVAMISELYDLAPSSYKEGYAVDEARLTSLKDSLKMLPFLEGESLRNAIDGVRSDIQGYVSTGSVGRSGKYAKTRSLELIAEIIASTEAILGFSERFRDAVENYMESDFETVVTNAQAERSAVTSLLLDSSLRDPNEAKVALSIIDALLARGLESKRDIRDPKYTGPVTPLPGTRALAVGATMPLIIRDTEFQTQNDIRKSTKVRNSYSESEDVGYVSAELSPMAIFSINVPQDIFSREDSGMLMEANSDLNAPIAGHSIICSADLEVENELLSERTHTSSVDGTEVQSVFFCPHLKTFVIPGSVEIVYNTVANQISPSSLSVQLTERLSTRRVATDRDSQSILYDQESGGVVGNIDYQTGVVFLSYENSTDIDVRVGVSITYRYNPFLHLMSYVPETQSFVTWNSVSLWVDNERISVPVTNYLNNTAHVRKCLSKISENLLVELSGDSISISLKYGGSASRIAFPESIV